MVAVSARGNRRRRRWLIATAIVAVVVVWAVVLGVKTLSAYHHDRDGLAALEQVKANLTPGQLTSSATERVLNQASAQFASAHSDLSSPFFAPVTVIPVIGRQFRAVRALGTAAGTVSQVGSTFLSEVTGLLNQPHSAGPERVASLRQLGAYSLSAERQLAAVDTGPSQALVAPLASKRNEFVTQLNAARLRLVKAAGVSAAVATILEGPQNYVVLASNNAEMRAGSGTYLEVGSATTSGGSVTLSGLSPSGDHALPVGAVQCQRRPPAQLGMAPSERGHAQPRIDAPVRRDRAARGAHVDRVDRPAGGRCDRARRGRNKPATRCDRSGGV